MKLCIAEYWNSPVPLTFKKLKIFLEVFHKINFTKEVLKINSSHFVNFQIGQFQSLDGFPLFPNYVDIYTLE